ncbi:MAG: ABC transporter ATP-binding protein [Arenibacterium sp.]
MMELHGLSKSYDGRPAIADMSLRVEDDEYLTLLGPSGSGKTTLLRLIAGLDLPDRGRISLNGKDIAALPTYLRGLGFVQQNYALFPHMTVMENVAFGLRNRVVDPLSNEQEIGKRVGDMLDLVGLAGLGDRMVGQISGGQKQRVSLARTLITEPKVCLLDEPLGALDANLRERMTVELRNIRKTLGVTFFHVTGNESEALAMGDRMIVLDEGRAIQIAPPDTIFDMPASIRVAKFVNSYNILQGEAKNGVFESGDLRLPVPQGIAAPRHIAIRFDAATISNAEETSNVGLKGTFIASEFMGSQVMYFFRTAQGQVFEVERHLSRSDPETFEGGSEKFLSWNVRDTLFFDANGDRLAPEQERGAA